MTNNNTSTIKKTNKDDKNSNNNSSTPKVVKKMKKENNSTNNTVNKIENHNNSSSKSNNQVNNNKNNNNNKKKLNEGLHLRDHIYNQFDSYSKIVWKLPLIILAGIIVIFTIWRMGTPLFVVGFGLLLIGILLFSPRHMSIIQVLQQVCTYGNIIYVLVIVYMITLDGNSQIRSFLSNFDPILGVQVKDKEIRKPMYCDIHTPNDPDGIPFRNLYNQMFTPWIGSHIFAWFCRYLLIRNVWFTWLLSMVFELFEISYRHVVPDFDECWWDHLIVDALLCNAFGILLGKICVKILGWEEHDWKPLQNIRHLFSLGIIYYLNTSMDLWTFIWPAGVEVKVMTSLNHFRVLWWLTHSIPSHFDLYDLAIGKKNNLLFSTWTTLLLALVELLFLMKVSSRLIFSLPPPDIIRIWYIVFISIALIAFLGFIKRRFLDKNSKNKNNKKHKKN